MSSSDMNFKIHVEKSSSNTKKNKQSRNFLKENAKQNFSQAIEQVEQIPHTAKEPTTMSKLKNLTKNLVRRTFRRELSKQTPERVNKQIDQLKTVGKAQSKEIDNFLSLPADLDDQFIGAFQAVVKQFQTSSDGAVDHYGEKGSSQYRPQRHNEEGSLENINTTLRNMMADLSYWHRFREARTETKKASPDDQQLQQDMRKALAAAKETYTKVLDSYQNKQVEPIERKKFREFVDKFIEAEENRKLTKAWEST
ncbi:MAG TPA: hypothetical protein VGL94_01410 [Ktedonobacteraceae bacterium]|jgi:hypothetical protein